MFPKILFFVVNCFVAALSESFFHLFEAFMSPVDCAITNGVTIITAIVAKAFDIWSTV